MTNITLCHCGTATKSPHQIEKFGCSRFIAAAPIFRGKHPELGCDMWDTGDGSPITDYTLRHQRGYQKHENGIWSRWESSTNSIEA